MKIKNINILIDSARSIFNNILQSDIEKKEVLKMADFKITRNYNLFFEFKSEDICFFGIGIDEEAGMALFDKLSNGTISDNQDLDLINSCLEELGNMIKGEAVSLLSKEKDISKIESIDLGNQEEARNISGVGITLVANTVIGDIEMYFIKK